MQSCAQHLGMTVPSPDAPAGRPLSAGDVDMPRLLHPNQSITFKGAVRLARRPGAGLHLHANASLFTCLVMDMPLERLKLRWVPGGLGQGLGANGLEFGADVF